MCANHLLQRYLFVCLFVRFVCLFVCLFVCFICSVFFIHHQTWHLWTGFIELFTGHWKASANSFELATAARTLQNNIYQTVIRCVLQKTHLGNRSKTDASFWRTTFSFKMIDSETECNFITFVRRWLNGIQKLNCSNYYVQVEVIIRFSRSIWN